MDLKTKSKLICDVGYALMLMEIALSFLIKWTIPIWVGVCVLRLIGVVVGPWWATFMPVLLVPVHYASIAIIRYVTEHLI